MKLISAPHCVQCGSECPNGLVKFPELIVCQKPDCPNYWLFQVWQEIMDDMDKNYPLK